MAGSGIRDEEGERGRYANHLSIDFSLSEVALSFGQRSNASSVPVIHSRIVSNPVDLVTFGHEIQATILRYERLYGRIPDATGPGPGATRK
jgi:hypothetical protein